MEFKLNLLNDETISKIDNAIKTLEDAKISKTSVEFTYAELKDFKKMITLEYARQELAAKTLRDALEFRKRIGEY